MSWLVLLIGRKRRHQLIDIRHGSVLLVSEKTMKPHVPYYLQLVFAPSAVVRDHYRPGLRYVGFIDQRYLYHELLAAPGNFRSPG